MMSANVYSLLSPCQLSQKGSLPVDAQAATPASVSSTDASSQQVSSDITASHEPKLEVKQPKEEEDDDDDEVDEKESLKGGGTGNKGDINIKTEEKPKVQNDRELNSVIRIYSVGVRFRLLSLQIKKEETSIEVCKGTPMETCKTEEEDRKPVIKTELKEEDAGQVNPNLPAGASSKKKSEDFL